MHVHMYVLSPCVSTHRRSSCFQVKIMIILIILMSDNSLPRGFSLDNTFY